MEQPLTLAPEPASARSRRRREPESPPAPIPLFGVKTIAQRSPDEPALSKAEFVEKVRQSNQACHDGDFHTAIVLYNEALAVDPQNCILYSNRSAAYMKTQQYHKALDDAIKARLLNPKWPKPTDTARNQFEKNKIIISHLPYQHCVKIFNRADKNLKNWKENI